MLSNIIIIIFLNFKHGFAQVFFSRSGIHIDTVHDLIVEVGCCRSLLIIRAAIAHHVWPILQLMYIRAQFCRDELSCKRQNTHLTLSHPHTKYIFTATGLWCAKSKLFINFFLIFILSCISLSYFLSRERCIYLATPKSTKAVWLTSLGWVL